MLETLLIIGALTAYALLMWRLLDDHTAEPLLVITLLASMPTAVLLGGFWLLYRAAEIPMTGFADIVSKAGALHIGAVVIFGVEVALRSLGGWAPDHSLRSVAIADRVTTDDENAAADAMRADAMRANATPSDMVDATWANATPSDMIARRP